MKQNKKTIDEKELFSLFDRLSELLDLRSNLPSIELVEPYQSGWLVNVHLREDIMRSANVELYLKLIDIGFGKDRYIRSVKDVRAIRKGKFGMIPSHFLSNTQSSYFPPRIKFSKWEVDQLSEQEKKYFLKERLWANHKKDIYYMNLPKYFYILKTTKNMVTHCKESDALIESEITLIENKLTRLNGYDKFFGKSYDRWGFKRYAKEVPREEVREEISEGIMDYEDDLNDLDYFDDESHFSFNELGDYD